MAYVLEVDDSSTRPHVVFHPLEIALVLPKKIASCCGHVPRELLPQFRQLRDNVAKGLFMPLKKVRRRVELPVWLKQRLTASVRAQP